MARTPKYAAVRTLSRLRTRPLWTDRWEGIRVSQFECFLSGGDGLPLSVPGLMPEHHSERSERAGYAQNGYQN
jgi:hypothetical protein